MFETIIMLLIQLCLFAIVCYIILYVLAAIGVVIPPKVIQLFWVIVALIVILILYRALAPMVHGRLLGWLPEPFRLA